MGQRQKRHPAFDCQVRLLLLTKVLPQKVTPVAANTRHVTTYSQVLPLVITVTFLAGLAFVGYHIYLSVVKIQAQAKQQMGNKNVVFTKDGLRVGVKHVKTEEYVDKTQSWVVKAWNLSGESTKDKQKK